MAGAFTAITQNSGAVSFMASGTLTQPADDNAAVHVALGFVPKMLYVSADPLAAVGAIQCIHLDTMAASDSTNPADGTDHATGAILRDKWTVTTAEYYIRGGLSVLSTASTADVITGFTLGADMNGGNSTVLYYWAIG